jgi:hypothetical protein
MTAHMTRRGFLGFGIKTAGAVAIGGAAGLLVKPKAVEANGNVWWENSLNQTQRNQAIISAAWPYIGGYGGQCKTWVQDVVKAASQNHVMLPPNNPAPNDYYWQYDYQYHAVGMSMSIEYVKPGYIIQMKLRDGGPHTAIVYACGGSLALIESNWLKYTNPLTVHVRTIDFSTFRSQVSAYAVYYVQ